MADIAPIIVKKKKVIHGGHHGGAWKVAYADFVTAMMAFFLLMWLLNATTEKQRKGIADYFSPTIPVHKVSGGGNGPLGGESTFSELTLPQNGRGASDAAPTEEAQAKGDTGASSESDADAEQKTSETLGTSQTTEDEEFELLEGMLEASSGESDVEDPLLSHVRTKVTDEGLIIELFDNTDQPLFEAGSDAPTPRMVELLSVINEVVGTVRNRIALAGHSFEAVPESYENANWQLSSNRAHFVRRVLKDGGLAPERLARVTGQANQEPAFEDLNDVRNNRVEIILLR